MKFVVSSSALLKQLSAISGVIASNPIVPILENFLFQLTNEKLIVTASDMQTSITTEFEVKSTSTGSIAIPAKLLTDTLRALSEQPVTFTIDEKTYSIEIISDNGRYKLAGENATDFPRLQSVNKSHSVEIASNVLATAINNTLFAVSTDDLKPAMTGLFVNLSETHSTFVATDGHRLIRYRRIDVTSDSNASLIIPRKALNLLKNTLATEETTVNMEWNNSNAFFSFNNIKMICRLIDERFPDYENAIPVNNPNILTISRVDLLSSLRRLSIYANKTTYQVRLKITASQIQISAEDLEFSNEANETLPCDYLGEDMEIGFNARFLIEMLSNLNSREIKFELSAPNRAGIIIPSESDENENIIMLAMPVMLNNYA